MKINPIFIIIGILVLVIFLSRMPSKEIEIEFIDTVEYKGEEDYAQTVVNRIIELCGSQPYEGTAWVHGEELITEEDQKSCMIWELYTGDDVDDCWAFTDSEIKDKANQEVVDCWVTVGYDWDEATKTEEEARRLQGLS